MLKSIVRPIHRSGRTTHHGGVQEDKPTEVVHDMAGTSVLDQKDNVVRVVAGVATARCAAT